MTWVYIKNHRNAALGKKLLGLVELEIKMHCKLFTTLSEL